MKYIPEISLVAAVSVMCVALIGNAPSHTQAELKRRREQQRKIEI